MPHKDRRKYLAYLAAYRGEHRPSPRAEPQADTDLPPRGRIVTSADGTRIQCHVCDGLDAEAYKELYDLNRTASLWAPATQAKQRDLAIARDQGAHGKALAAHLTGRPKGIAARLQSRVDESAGRKGRYFRGGNK